MINGVLTIYKEKGYTSHDVVARLRGIVGQKKIGHTGTLDPDAEGVLPVCLGKATKLCDMLTDKDKTYEAVLLLGTVTDTQDISGQILEQKSTETLSETETSECIQRYIGTYEQLPPMYSALKVNGKKLYELAREGKTVERKRRKVTIYGIRILEMDLPKVRMEVHCSKGTYIRTLCHDIGESLGCGGCMESLLRTKAGRFTMEESMTLAQAEEYKELGTLKEHILPIDAVFEDLTDVIVQETFCPLAYNGNALEPDWLTEQMQFSDEEKVRVYTPERRFVGVYTYKQRENRLKVEKMFLDREEI